MAENQNVELKVKTETRRLPLVYGGMLDVSVPFFDERDIEKNVEAFTYSNPKGANAFVDINDEQLRPDDRCYGSKNYIILPRDSVQETTLGTRFYAERNAVAIKLGRLYVVYDFSGKGGFRAKIYEIDPEAKKTHELFGIGHGKWTKQLQFRDILPFHEALTYSEFTRIIPRREEWRKDVLKELNLQYITLLCLPIRKCLTQLAQGKKIDFELLSVVIDKLYKKLEGISNVNVTKGSNITRPAEQFPAQKKNASIGAADIQNLAEAFFKIYIEDLELTSDKAEKISELFFSAYNSDSLKQLDLNDFLQKLLNTKLEQGRLSVKMFAEDKEEFSDIKKILATGLSNAVQAKAPSNRAHQAAPQAANLPVASSPSNFSKLEMLEQAIVCQTMRNFIKKLEAQVSEEKVENKYLNTAKKSGVFWFVPTVNRHTRELREAIEKHGHQDTNWKVWNSMKDYDPNYETLMNTLLTIQTILQDSQRQDSAGRLKRDPKVDGLYIKLLGETNELLSSLLSDADKAHSAAAAATSRSP
jgi:hypothetical protein